MLRHFCKTNVCPDPVWKPVIKVHICIYIQLYIYIYTHNHICTYMYICIYTYIHTYSLSSITFHAPAEGRGGGSARLRVLRRWELLCFYAWLIILIEGQTFNPTPTPGDLLNSLNVLRRWELLCSLFLLCFCAAPTVRFCVRLRGTS